MTRYVNSSAQTAADGTHVVYAILVTLDFASGFVRMFNGAGTIVFNGNTFTGVGQYGSIETINESTDLRPANPVTMKLSGLPDAITPAFVAAVSNRADYFGRSARVDYAIFDPTARTVLTPVENAVWEGQMDQMTVSRQDNSIAIICEDRMVIWDKTINIFYTTEWQQILYPGDTGFDQVPFLADRQINWGGGPTVVGGPGTGGTPRWHNNPSRR